MKQSESLLRWSWLTLNSMQRQKILSLNLDRDHFFLSIDICRCYLKPLCDHILQLLRACCVSHWCKSNRINNPMKWNIQKLITDLIVQWTNGLCENCHPHCFHRIVKRSFSKFNTLTYQERCWYLEYSQCTNEIEAT